MRTLYFLLEKEVRILLRNKGLLRMLILAPLIQLILMPMAADYSVKNISIAVVDNDHTQISRQMIDKITASGHFKLTGYKNNYLDALDMLENDKADLVLEIPKGFDKNLVRENNQQLYITINAIEGTKANLGGAYLGSIIANYNAELRMKWIPPTAAPSVGQQISVASSNWYNPYMNYHLYIVPAILVSLLTAMSSMQAAFNIVQEKENGTIEQINVTPIKKHIFILGKLLPFLVLSTIVFTLGLGIARLFYGIVPVGNFAVLYVSLIIYLFAMLGMGLLISTYSETQQQAMSLSFFFTMIFNMMSGMFTSVDSMPDWAKAIANLFPPSHFIKIMRMVVMKGSGFADISSHLYWMLGIGMVLTTWAVLNYRKTIN